MWHSTCIICTKHILQKFPTLHIFIVTDDPTTFTFRRAIEPKSTQDGAGRVQIEAGI